MYQFIILASVVVAITAQSPYSSFCLQNLYGADQQNHFPDTSDCHYYINCDFFNSTYAVGTRQKCPDGQFWRPPVVSCLPEGTVPCADRCLSEDATNARGCYAGTGCRQYFACANFGSYGMCCPEGTEFVEANCACETSTTCSDFCEQVAPAQATTTKPSQIINATVCKDSFDSMISTVPGENNAYILLTDAGVPTGKQYCASGTIFNFGTCRCDIDDPNAVVPPPSSYRKATVLITFDNDIKDASPNNFETFLYNGAERDTSNAAIGTGSLAVNGGFLTIPGLKSGDFRGNFSVCAFFSGTSGGLYSNNRDSTNQEFSFRVGLRSANVMAAAINYRYPIGLQSFDVPFVNTNSWNHYCCVLTENLKQVYVNGQVTGASMPDGLKFISHAPARIGNDPFWGSLNGNIDEVLAVNFALSAQEVEYHRTGNYAALDLD